MVLSINHFTRLLSNGLALSTFAPLGSTGKGRCVPKIFSLQICVAFRVRTALNLLTSFHLIEYKHVFLRDTIVGSRREIACYVL